MKEGLRQRMAWLHTWSGLVAGWVLFFVFVTGTAGFFQHEITRWMQPERSTPRQQVVPDIRQAIGHALDRLEQVAPAAALWQITLPHWSIENRNWQDLAIRWEDMPKPEHTAGLEGTERLDPVTGAVMGDGIEVRATSGGAGLYTMHYVLHYMPALWGIYLVGACTMLMLLTIVSGVITHKKIFKDFFTFRPGKGQRSWLDAHNAFSVMALPFFLMITYSGLVFFMVLYMPAGKTFLYGAGPEGTTAYFQALTGPKKAVAAISRPRADVAALLAQAERAWGHRQVDSILLEREAGHPAQVVITRANGKDVNLWRPHRLRYNADTGEALPDRPTRAGAGGLTADVTLSLHEGLFADYWGRWLYFLAGLLGCAMIGTGLVLWTVKRRKHLLASGLAHAEHFGIRLVEVLNVATLAGLPMAVAAYFWANRLLPVGIADRPAWEFHSLFAVWLGTLFYAVARPLHRAWIELLWAACLSYALLPLLNALTTDKHLLNTLPHALGEGDWVFAGFDLTMWALGALLAVMAVKVSRRLGGKAMTLTLNPADPALSPRRETA